MGVPKTKTTTRLFETVTTVVTERPRTLADPFSKYKGATDLITTTWTIKVNTWGCVVNCDGLLYDRAAHGYGRETWPGIITNVPELDERIRLECARWEADQ